MTYHIGHRGVQSGPFSEDTIREKLAAGEIAPDALCWASGWAEWRPVREVFLQTPPASLPPPISVLPPPVAGAPGEPAKTSGLAIASLVCGVLAFGCMLTTLPAIICGHLALSDIKKSAGARTGQGLAIAGLVLGYVTFAMVPLMAAMAIPAFQKVRVASQQKAIENNLRQLDAAAEQFMLETGRSSASYADLVGTGDHHYIRELRPISGENYTDLVIRARDREISVTTADGRVIRLQRVHMSEQSSFATP